MTPTILGMKAELERIPVVEYPGRHRCAECDTPAGTVFDRLCAACFKRVNGIPETSTRRGAR